MGLFKGTHTTTRADKISSFTVNTAEYGASVPEVLGTTRIGGNVIYYDDFTATEHKETQSAGKGGGSKSTSIWYTYSVAAIMALCEGPISGVGKVWVNKEVYTYPDAKIQLTLKKGTASQTAWSYVTSKHPDKAMPYANLAYMYGVIDMGDSASLPQYNFEVKGKLLSTGDGVDVNPADYIRYVVDKIGLDDVTIEGLSNYRQYCALNDMLISSPPDTGAKKAQEILNEIATLTNVYIFWSNDRFKVVPVEVRNVGGWQADTSVKYALTSDDFIPQSGGALVTYSRKDSSEVYNSFPVEFINRSNGYESETVTYQLTDDIAEYGLRQAPTQSAHYVYTKARAIKIAEMLARKAQYERNLYTFKLDWAFCRLEPGDLVQLTDEYTGLDEQICRIQTVTEGQDGLLTITAVAMPDDVNYDAPDYDVHEVDRPYVDYNADPGDVDTPLIMQPPAEITDQGYEIWLGAHGTSDNWGGCTVYVSDDNINYRQVGQITNSARIGDLVYDMTANDTSCTIDVNGTMVSGTAQDAQRANTLCWLDGECFSYQTATLTASGRYTLSGLVRGQYHTSKMVHSAGEQFARLDEALLRHSFLKEDIGKTLYFKFCSYNIFGGGEQSLADVDPYQYTITSYYIPFVENLTAYNRYRQIQDGVSRYDIVVKWTPPTLNSYLQGQVWYKSNHAQAIYTTVNEGVSADELGWDGEWIYGGTGYDAVAIPQAIVGDTYRIAVVTVDKWGQKNSADLAPSIDVLVALKTAIPNTPDNFTVTFGEEATFRWEEVTNADIAFYELRTDRNPGVQTSGLLGRTNNLSMAFKLTNRTGTVYLYARSAIGKYSAPAMLTYNKPKPKTPRAPQVTAKLGGMAIVADDIPADALGMMVYIDGAGIEDDTVLKTPNSEIGYQCDANIYDVAVAYYDMFGPGGRSGETRCTVKVLIDAALLEAEAISLEKCDAVIQDAVSSVQNINETIVDLRQTDTAIQSTVSNMHTQFASQITQQANQITSIVTALNGNPESSSYSAIAQLSDAIELRVKSDEVISKINLSPSTVTIDGKYIHVTGDTVIDNNLITRGMIQANAVTADKIDVSSLSAISATIGTLRTATSGARLEITSNVIRVYDANNVLRVRMGVW